METENIKESYELLKIVLDFVSKIVWPIIVIIVLLLFREEIRKLFDKAKKLELPGGISIETVDDEISKAQELAEEIKNERKPEIQTIINQITPDTESLANRRMIELGLEASPSGLNLNYYKQIAEIDLRLAMVGLRIDFEMMLRNLAKGFRIPVQDKEPVSKTISNLFSKSAITSRQYEFINTIFKISNAAAHGAEITKEQVFQVLDIGQVLVDDYVAWLDWGFNSDYPTANNM